MTKLRILALLVVVAHWIVVLWHLFLTTKILPAPDNNVTWLAIALITSGHLLVAIALWKLRDRPAGLVALLLFLAVFAADLYEHFLHPAPNNVFMTPAGAWTFWFDASVVGLVELEILVCSLGILLLSRRLTPSPAT